jgi:hypothetical protein
MQSLNNQYSGGQWGQTSNNQWGGGFQYGGQWNNNQWGQAPQWRPQQPAWDAQKLNQYGNQQLS